MIESFEFFELSQKQLAYCEGILKGLSKRESLKKAGYAGTTLTGFDKVEKSPNVQNYLRRRRYELMIKSNITVDSQIKDLEIIKRRCMQAKPVMEWVQKGRNKELIQKVDEEGNVVYEFDSMGAIRAIEAQNKLLGLNEPEKIDIIVNQNPSWFTGEVINSEEVNNNDNDV